MRTRLLLTLGLVVSAAGCRDCEDLGAAVPNGAIDPAVYEFGPLTLGSECTAELFVTNLGGRTDLAVENAVLENVDGDFTLQKAPTLVRLGGSESLLVDYTAAGEIGDTQSATVRVTTDDPDNEGVLLASVTAIVTDAAAPTVKSSCNDVSPCASLDFGAVQLNGAGLILPVTILNDGTADMEVTAAVIDGGNADFQVVSVRRGSAVIDLPAVVPPGRSSECGAPSGEDNAIIIDVRYVPSALGADVDTLIVLTNAVNAAQVDVPLAGVGSDVGILMTPSTINFGELGEGQTDAVDVLVSNVGTSTASVNFACIDLENDDTCEADCTGQPADTALNGTLACGVTTSAGAAESEGFVLAATDAQPGGEDERTVTVTWAPIAGTTSIPATAVLALHSNILGDRVFTAPIIGGSLGVISVSSTELCGGGQDGVCVPATGDPADTTTWTGTATVTLTNTGAATVNIGAVDEDCGSTIADDFSAAPITDATLAPGESGDIVVTYTNNDFSQVDPCNLLVHHDGAGALTTIPLDIVAPQ